MYTYQPGLSKKADINIASYRETVEFCEKTSSASCLNVMLLVHKEDQKPLSKQGWMILTLTTMFIASGRLCFSGREGNNSKIYLHHTQLEKLD